MNADVTIIGGGIAGLACAVTLAEAGAAVVVVDAGQIYPPASATPLALLVPPSPRHEQLHTLATQSLARYPQWCQALRSSTGIDPRFVARTALRLVPPGDTRQTFPTPAYLDDRLVAGVQTIPVAQLHAPSLLAALRTRLTTLSTRLITTTVHALSVNRGRCRSLILGNGMRLRTEHVILCAGGFTNHLLRPLGVTLPLLRLPGTVVQYQQVPTVDQILFDGYSTLVLHDGLLHVASTDDADAVTNRVRRLFGVGSLATIWHGVRVRGPKGIPIVQTLSPYTNLHVATGFGRNGFLLAPLVARMLTAEITQRGVRGALPAA